MRYSEFLERSSFTKEELLALTYGTLVTDPPAEFFRLPGVPFLMFDRVVELQKSGTRGRIVAEQDVAIDHWTFQCHFRGDPVQPGCLGVDAIWQIISLYNAAAGAPGAARALGCKEVDFSGQIRPHNKVVRYEIDIRRYSLFADSGTAVAVGNGRVIVDGETIYTVSDAKVGMFLGIEYSDYPRKSANAVGGIMDRSRP